MNIANYLEKHQKIAYSTFLNALNHDRLAHAYLLSGSQGIPLLEISYLFAKSLICENRIDYACDNCLSCIRIDEKNYADIIVLDGSVSSIKKEEIRELENRFNKTAIEEKQIMIYIIHLVENMTAEAINSLLKFLEEPGKNIYAFLTTENENRVLPTIISRSQTLKFKAVNASSLKIESIEIGVNSEDVELLLHFYYEAHALKNASEDSSYIEAKKCFLETLNALNDGKNAIFPILHKSITPTLKSKESLRYYLDMLQIAFTDLLNIKIDQSITLQSYVIILNELASKLSHLQESLLEIMLVRSQIDLNVNSGLLLDHLMIYILKGDNVNGRNK